MLLTLAWFWLHFSSLSSGWQPFHVFVSIWECKYSYLSFLGVGGALQSLGKSVCTWFRTASQLTVGLSFPIFLCARDCICLHIMCLRLIRVHSLATKVLIYREWDTVFLAEAATVADLLVVSVKVPCLCRCQCREQNENRAPFCV